MSAPVISPDEACARVRQAIDEHATTGYRPREAAAEIVEKLRHNQPELLSAWLDVLAEQFVWQAINDRDRSRRGRATHEAKSSAFRQAREAAEGGDVAPLRRFLDSPYSLEDGTRRRLAELRRDDLLYVSSTYERRARENGMRAAFMDALAKKVGRGTVADKFTEETLTSMWTSLTG